jgi:hypothetical protein
VALIAIAAFVALLWLPAIALLHRLFRDVVHAAAAAVLLAVPWYFLRKLAAHPLPFDAASCALATLAATRTGATRELLAAARPTLSRARWLLALQPLVAALAWLGWNAPAGNEVREYGLFAIDFGNLVSVVSTLRASPMLPLSFVDGGGPLSYHWLYFTLPATLADFLGASMPNSTALWLANLLLAWLLIYAVTTVASARAAVLMLFAPYATYFYQAVAARIPLGPLALPARNHLLLSPLNSMLVFGNNTFALVLALVVLVSLERWNRDGRLRDAVIVSVALAAVIGYSVTLLFPLLLALGILTMRGRVRRPLIALPLAATTGVIALLLFRALNVLTSGGSRQIAVGFDRGAFLKMLAFGLVPLWGLLVLGWRRRSFPPFAVLAISCVLVPSFLYINGGPTGATDFSMKTASLLALSLAPLLAEVTLPERWRVVAASLLVALGVVQTAAYVLQFPYYRARQSHANGVALPRDYFQALQWLRDGTPRTAVVVDPASTTARDELFPIMLAERRVWLPTPYTNSVLIAAPPPTLAARTETWRAAAAGDVPALTRVAREADYLVTAAPVAAPSWQALHREGAFTIYRSTLHSPRP